MTLQQMAQEYRVNGALIELRIIQLRCRLQNTRQLELRRRLKKRIGTLYGMLGESRRAAYDMQHYYDQRESHGAVGRCS
ncbi:MAG: hypothetical protein AB7C89_00175 [Intestinibacillus sp.]